jgi:N utilization substance protein B
VSAKRPAPRHRSRRVALQALYAADLAERGREPRPGVEEVFERVAAHFDLQEGARAFAKELVCGVAAVRGALDARIAAHARNWRVERMAAVDRNVLRLATFELERGETPYTVVIDEAVELAREFGSERSPAFVNGVLDAIARTLRERPANEGVLPAAGGGGA